MTLQYQLLPDLTDEEYQSLKKDIKDHGVQVPIEFDEAGNVLDGHHRLRICQEEGIKDYPSIVRIGLSEDDKIDHVLSLNLNRRHLDQDQRKELHAKLSDMGWSLRRIAEKTKVAPNTVRSDIETGVQNCTPKKVTGKDGKEYPAKKTAILNKNSRDKQRALDAAANTPPELFPIELLDSKQAKKTQKDYEKQSKIDELSNHPAELPIDVSIMTGDFRQVLNTFPENSIDLIFTDPPYDEESIHLYGDLARLGARILKPGGSLLVYAGHYALPQYFEIMTPHLRYWWIIALLQHEGGGGNARLIGKNVYVQWKPILWFVKEKRGNNEYVGDSFITPFEGKDYHEWQQAIDEAEYYINHLTDPGNTVLDPLCGSGTTLIAAKKNNRIGIGIEIDEQRVSVASNRIYEYFGEESNGTS